MATPLEQFRNMANTAHWVDLIVRYDGENVRIQGDWVKLVLKERDELEVAVRCLAKMVRGAHIGIPDAVADTLKRVEES